MGPESFLGGAVEKLKSFIRGYSQEDFEKARRILVEGIITSVDREEYVRCRLEEVFHVPIIDLKPWRPLSKVVENALAKLNTEAERLRNLPPELFDQEIRAYTRMKAKRWDIF